MSLKGTLDTMPLPDLLQWLGAARKTGVVALTQGSVTKKIVVRDGFVISAESNDPSEFLGQMLLSYGRISERELSDALEVQRVTREFLGALLVRSGAISEAELARMLCLKTEETVYSLFEWEKASFDYEDGDPKEVPFSVSLSVEDILLKGARRFDEMARIREVIPSTSAVPRRTPVPLPTELLQRPNLKRLADAVDGVRSIAGIALHTHTSEFFVCKFAFETLRAGLIEIAAAKAPEPRCVASEIGTAARRLFDAGEYEGVLMLLDHEDVDPEDPLREILRISEDKFVQDAYDSLLRPDRIPELLKPVSELYSENLSPEEFFLISRIDGVWNLGSIVSISPLREVDALKVLSRLKKRGIIRIKDAPVPARQ